MINIARMRMRQEGLTLLELLVIIAVLAIVAAIAIPVVTNVVSSGNQKALAQTQEDVNAFVAKYNNSGTYTYSDGVFTGYIDLDGNGSVSADEKIEELAVDTNKFSISASDSSAPDSIAAASYGSSVGTTFTLSLTAAAAASTGYALTGWSVYSSALIVDQAPTDASYVQVQATSQSGLALKSDGTVVEWGNALGAPAGLSDVVAISASYDHALALKSDGTVVAWGNTPAVPAGLSGVTAISAGTRLSLALKSDGTVVAWGTDYGSQVSGMPAGLTDVVAISAGAYIAAAVKSDGTVVAWGTSNVGQPAGLTGVTKLAAGNKYILALKSDGTVVSWGNFNNNGQMNVPAGLTDVVAIDAEFGGSPASYALKSDGSLVAWGGPAKSRIPGGAIKSFAVGSSGGVALLEN